MSRKSQEMPHETLSTMLADYGGNGPGSAFIHAAFHPNPIRRIDLELPPSAAALRRSIEAQAHTEVVQRLGGGGGAAAASYGGGGCEGPAGAGALSGRRARVSAAAAGGGQSGGGQCGDLLLGPSGSAVDLLEDLLRHGRGAPPGGALSSSNHTAGGPAAAAGGGGGRGAGAAARSASLPAGSLVAAGSGTPGWLGSVPLGGPVNLRGSMLAAESTFIFPAGLQLPAAASDAGGGGGVDEPELGSGVGGRASAGAAELPSSSSSTGVTAWDTWEQQQQQHQGSGSRHTTSAPGYLSSRAGACL